MSEKLRKTVIRCFIAGILLCLLVIALAGVSLLLTSPHTKGTTDTGTPTAGIHTNGTPLAACAQPPAGKDWLHSSAQDLVRYGLPARPLSVEAIPAWLALLQKFKHRSCSISLRSSGKVHNTNQETQYQQDCPPGMSCENPTWAGAVAEEQKYLQVQSVWTLPCIKGGTKDTSSSTWVGLGGVLNKAPLVQAGVDTDLDTQGRTVYEAWVEAYIPASGNTPFKDNQAILNFAQNFHCGDQIYVNVSSDTSANGADTPNAYFIGNVTTGEYAYYNPDWPVSDGASVEWIVEQPTFVTNGQVSFKPLTNFGTLSFGACTATLADHTLRLAGMLPLKMTTIRKGSASLATATRRDVATIEVKWLRAE